MSGMRARRLCVSLARRLRASLARRLGLDHNPLRRGTDRAEAWFRIIVVALFLISAPVVTLTAARWAGSVADSATRPSIRQVSATLLRPTVTETPSLGRRGLSWAPARWAGPDGSTHTGDVQAPADSRAGSTVKIWIDSKGKVTRAPLTHAQVLSREITAIALTPMALALVYMLVLGIIHHVSERRRMQAWATAWSAVEPRWTRRIR